MSDLRNVTHFLSETGKRNLALEIINHFSKYANSPALLRDIADSYFYSYDFEKSFEFFNMVIKGDATKQEKAECLLNMANIHIVKSQPQEALKILNNMDDSAEVVGLKKEANTVKENISLVSETGYWGHGVSEKHAFSQEMANWLALNLNSSKMLHDFGCGLGCYLKHLSQVGFSNLVGYEGVIPKDAVFKNIRSQDLSVGFSVECTGNVLCLEVGEHIPARYQDVFMDNICMACDNMLVLSWAKRGQPGFVHVNCLNNDEVIPEIEKRGFSFLEKETIGARLEMGESCYWFKDTLMLFKKK